MLEKKWFIIQSYYGCEFRVKKFLHYKIKNSNMEAYFGRIFVPTEDIIESKDGKKFIKKKKLFPGYVLIEMYLCDKTLDLVRYLPNIFGFIGSVKFDPSILSNEEIEKILIKTAETEVIPRPKVLFQVGDLIRIVTGPFSDFSGTVVSMNYEKCRLCVTVMIFGRSTPIELDFDQVEKN